MRNGVSPRATALDIVGRLNRATGQREGGVIGLTRATVRQVHGARQAMLSGATEGMRRYLGYARRDHRFDPIVARAIAEGRPVPADQARKIAGRLEDRYLVTRGETIARTELLQSLHAAQDESLAQLVDRGVLKPEQINRTWDATEDAATRPSHRAAEGQVVKQSETFVVGGYKMKHPGDRSFGAPAEEIVNCRCRVRVWVDHLAGLREAEGRPPPAPDLRRPADPGSGALVDPAVPRPPKRLERIQDARPPVTFKSSTTGQTHTVSTQDLDVYARRVAATSNVEMRISDSGLEKAIRAGRFKNQFETGTSGGLKNLEVRRRLEANLMGIPLDAEDAARPIYGYLNDGTIDQGWLKQYGGTRVVFRRDRVAPRTTFTGGDSLSANAALGKADAADLAKLTDDQIYDAQVLQTLPQPLNAPTHRALPLHKYTAPARYRDGVPNDLRGFHDYMEAQIYGPRTLDDVEEIVFPAKPGGKLQTLLRDAGIDWRVEP